MSEKPRALGVVRLSVGNENQTGEDTQRTRISKRADAEEMELVDFAVDIDVSASISPWVRPSLGDWLSNKKDQFDHIIILKIDRIARSVRHLSDIIEWCEANGKGLISCEEGFDLSKPWGKTIAKILAVVAEAELDAIKARNRASRETMRKTGRWPGGLVPFGRRAVKGDAGFTLELDPEYGPTLIEMIRRFIEKPSFSAVADWLNEQGVPTAQDIARIRAAAGESTTRLADPKPRGARWTPTTVQAVLISRSLLGEYVRASGAVARNDDGTPVMRSEPVLNEEEWTKLSEAVASVKYKKQKGSTSPTVGVTFCLLCGSALYFVKGDPAKGKRERYRCHGNKTKGIPACPKQRFWAEDLYPWLESALLGEIGHLERMESKTTIDDSRAAKLAVIDGRMIQLLKELQQGEISAVAYGSQVASLAQDREKVTSQEGPKPVTVWTGTGEGYAEWWERSSVDERREWLKKHKVKAYFGHDVLAIDPGDLIENIKQQGITYWDVPSKSSQVLSPITPISLHGKPYEKPKPLTGVEWEIVSRWEDFDAERAAQRAKAEEEAKGAEVAEMVPISV
ncbi:recombinase family protein [Streptomyces sp. MB09-02B]|uniref:recombinase family protein n=1 Tax=Streptomyces sp. MB09-02B TaxID=3028667 RepID=UPI0029A05FF6|nr:recombinase family protein [Streptomyces sp. MB09-02B]MDX3640040.1 recombinase family protein [Streptomyces sp. MB09-02B]